MQVTASYLQNARDKNFSVFVYYLVRVVQDLVFTVGTQCNVDRTLFRLSHYLQLYLVNFTRNHCNTNKYFCKRRVEQNHCFLLL